MTNDSATKARMYAEAVKRSLVAMGPDAFDAAAFFKRGEQLFLDYGISAEFQAKVISPLLNDRAKAILSKLTPDITSVYAQLKNAILPELDLSANTYLERFYTCVKDDDESFVSYASKLKSLLEYYLDSRGVKKFEDLCKLLICDRIKNTLSNNCLKYVLSVESGRKKSNWLPVKELTASVDRFVAARDDSFRPRTYTLGQGVQRGSRPPQTGVASLRAKQWV